MKDYYQILGVARGADEAEIKKAEERFKSPIIRTTLVKAYKTGKGSGREKTAS